MLEKLQRLTEPQFQAAFASAPMAVVLVNRQWRYLFANAAACRLLGYSEAELKRSNFLTTLHPDNLDRDLEAFERLQAGTLDGYETERQFFQQTGRLAWIKLSVAVVRGANDAAPYYIAHLQDITTHKHAEEEKKRLQELVRRQETMSAMGALVGGVAHEVRNPLFAITATIDAMENRLGHVGEYTRYVKVLRNEAARMTELMQRLLEYGKPDTSEHRTTSLIEVVREAVRICALHASTRQVFLRFREQGLPPMDLAMDAPRVTAAFQNLIDNAVQFSPPGGSVEIDLQRDHGRALCTIRDHGLGFQSGDETRIFQPFFTRRPGGTGLGLSIVQKTIDEHGGEISAANHPDGGAVISVEFPL